MPTLAELQDFPGDDPTLLIATSSGGLVEPLDGPGTVDHILDRFPETVYDQSRDTHLYRFLSALTGDAGAGLLKKQTFTARLRNEGELLTFTDLDSFYVQHFRFARLKREIYDVNGITGVPFDPSSDILTKEEWDDIQMKDELYRHRVMLLFNGIRLGSTPDGIELIAEAGSGVICDVIENYKAIYDELSDDPLGLELQGVTGGVNEYIVQPKLFDNDGNPDDTVTYTSDLRKDFVPTGTTGTYEYDPGAFTFMSPDVERNMIDILDRLRPVSALMSVSPERLHYNEIGLDNCSASSGKVSVLRYVTGRPDVVWPELDTAVGQFIENGTEAEATHLPLSIRELPTVYQTIERAFAYTDKALADPAYGQANDPTILPKYSSEHIGAYTGVFTQIYTFLQQVPKNVLFSADKGLAIQNTQLNFEGSSK